MTDPEDNLCRVLHEKFSKRFGLQLRYALHSYIWHDFLRFKFTEADLDAVLAYVSAENAKRDHQFRIRTGLAQLIGNLPRFDELRAEADLARRVREAEKRKAKPTAGQIALGAMRHEEVQIPEQPERKVSMEMINGLIGDLRRTVE